MRASDHMLVHVQAVVQATKEGGNSVDAISKFCEKAIMHQGR